jgi:2-methylcitrate dehydratase PrpD
MFDLDRRSFLRAATVASIAAAGGSTPMLAAPQTGGGGGSQSLPPDKGITRTLARYVVNAKYEDLPPAVRKEGVRTLLNFVGVAVGASRHDGVNDAIAALTPFSGPPQAGILGRRERFDILNAAMINGISAHIFDYDDTHLRTIIHPGTPVIPGILALAEYRPVSGKDFLNAVVIGVEVALRIGNSVTPEHYDRGWHSTGTCGVFGAAAAAGMLLGLNEQQMVWALGLAASQPIGLRESFGSMNKSFNPGRAANDGLMAAILASKNYTSSDEMIEAKRGWANTVSTRHDYREITEGLGKHYEAALNTYKPFACGIVLHPAIDAAIQLRNQYKITADQVDHIDLRVNPLVLELTGKKTPYEGLEGKFSIYHSVAVAVVEGSAGEKQFSERAVRDPIIVGLRSRVVPVIDPSIKPEQVDLTIVLKDGRKLHKHIEHAVGSLEVPMTDSALEAKFSDLAEGILPAPHIRRLLDVCWGVEKLPSAAAIAQAATV